MANLTGKTIGDLALLTGITSNTLFPVELSGSTYHMPYSSILSVILPNAGFPDSVKL